MITHISLIEFTVKHNLASVYIIKEGIYPIDVNSVAIQFYVVLRNKDALHPTVINYYPNKCCLNDDGFEDCNLAVFGGQSYLKPKENKTLFFVYPTLFPYNQIGHCHFILEYNYYGIKKRSSIEWIREFDTRFTRKNILFKNLGRHKNCVSLDLDPLENCDPVNCDQKYNGERSYFDAKINRCIKIPICVMDPTKDLPDVVYDPTSNTCKDLGDSFNVADAYAISSQYGVVVEPTVTEKYKVPVKSNCTTISQNLQLLRDLMYGKLYSTDDLTTTDYTAVCKSAIITILTCIVSLCVFLLFLVFCMNGVMWLSKKISSGDLKKYFEDLRSKLKKPKFPDCMTKVSKVNKEVTNKLLKDVIVSDLPIELRESAVDICERIGKEVKRKKRYRMVDIGSQISLMEAQAESSSSSYDNE